MKNPDFSIPQRIAKDYERAIKYFCIRVIPPKLPGQSYEDWLAGIVKIGQRQQVQETSNFLAKKMVYWVNVKNAQSWRQAAARVQRSQKLYNLLKTELQGALGSRVSHLVRENSRLISSVPQEAAEALVREITVAQQQGSRPETIAKMMRVRFPQLLKSRINLIARTETQKASTELTRARSEALNLQFYIWSTSEDIRVRRSHKKMNNVIIPWATPPAPELLMGEKSTLGHYHAGECPNCRCTQIVVLTLEDIRFPARVYWQGKITYMTKPQFRQIAGALESRAA